MINEIVVNGEQEQVESDVKEAVSSLSPIIRNRLRGLPAYVLDYSDLIVANSVEKPFLKPVVLVGPTTGEKQVRPTWPRGSLGGVGATLPPLQVSHPGAAQSRCCCGTLQRPGGTP